MTIKQLGGVFGRNPTFNDVTVEGDSNFNDLTVKNLTVSDANPIVDVVATTNADATLNLREAGTGIVGAELVYDGGSNIFEIKVGNNSSLVRLAIGRDSGDVTVSSGNLIIGTSGKGIDFSATAGTGTSELLDDYEEGTWTPVPFGATSAGTYSTTFVAGNYVLVGKIITINCTVAVTSFTGTGDFRISGLPYPAAASQGSLLTVQYNNSPFATLTSTNQLVVGQLNSSEIRFRASSSVAGGAFETPQCSASTVSYLRVSGSYEVA